MHTPNSLHHTGITLKTICTLAALSFVTAFLQIVIVEMYKEFYIKPRASKYIIELTEQEKKQQEIHDAQKEFTLDGTLYLVNYNVKEPGVMGEGIAIVKDINNNTLFKGKEKDNPYAFIPWYSKKRTNYGTINQHFLESLNTMDGEFTSTHAVPMVDAMNKRMGHWLWDNQKRYFTYYGIDGTVSGYIGSGGYSAQAQQVKSFGNFVRADYWLKLNSYDPMMLYRSESAVYQIDFRNQQVETLYDNPNDPVRSVEMNNWEEVGILDYRPALSIITKSHKLFLFLKNPQQVIKTQLTADLCYFSSPSLAVVGDKIWAHKQVVVGAPITDDFNIYHAWIMKNLDKTRNFKITLFEMDKDRNFLEKNSFSWTQPKWQTKSDFADQGETFPRFVLSFSSPLPRLIFDRLENMNHNNYYMLPVYLKNLLDVFFETSKFYWPANLSILAVFTAITLLHGWPRRTSVIKLAFWIGFVLLFNLAGFLTYLAMNHTSVVQCASCGKRRGLEKDACCRCGTVLPSPKNKETDLITTLSA